MGYLKQLRYWFIGLLTLIICLGGQPGPSLSLPANFRADLGCFTNPAWRGNIPTGLTVSGPIINIAGNSIESGANCFNGL